jgi:DNA-binding NtrC family response regulator
VPRCGLVEAAGSVDAAQQLFARLHFDLIILDITLPGRSGLEWLNELREKGQQCDVILITAFADIETAIHALRAGASDFILKPFRIDQMMNAVGRCFDRAGLLRENYVLRREIARQTEGVEGMVGESAPVRELAAVLRRAAGMPSTVLLTGESGVGKEVAARALHEMSPRASAPFVPGQLRRHQRRADRIGVVRSREGRLHRRAGQLPRTALLRPGRHAVSR